MTDGLTSPDDRPSPEELMAFADGELSPARREAVSDWLAGHGEDAAEVEDFALLRRWCEGARAPEPSPQAWDRTLAAVHHALSRRTRSRLPAGRVRWALAAVSVAAAALLALSLYRPMGKAPEPRTGEPYPVADANEIDIVSMDPHDDGSLVGRPPLLANLQFAAPRDVKVLRVEGHPAGWGAKLDDGEVPMVVALPPDGPDDR